MLSSFAAGSDHFYLHVSSIDADYWSSSFVVQIKLQRQNSCSNTYSFSAAPSCVAGAGTLSGTKGRRSSQRDQPARLPEAQASGSFEAATSSEYIAFGAGKSCVVSSSSSGCAIS